ncbi:unnamed protein product, partial [Mesorhabditis spiculigera]
MKEITYQVEGRNVLRNDARCKLRAPVADLIAMVFNENFLKERMLEFHIDAEKITGTGNLMRRIERAYEALDRIRDAATQAKTDERLARLERSTIAFYELIPHHERAPLDTEELIDKKIEQLGELIELAEIEQMMDKHGSKEPRHILDQLYDHIKCDIVPLQREEDDFKMIERYILESGNSQYGDFRCYDVAAAFSLRRGGEDAAFRKDLPNRTLLWHGSNVVNYCGIFTQGLRIAPKEAAYITGQAYGRGLYFSDNFNVSMGYCRVKADEEPLILLCEVALGKSRNFHTGGGYHSDSGKSSWNSTFVGFGDKHTIEDPASFVPHPDGYGVPLSPHVDRTSTTEKPLRQNFYVVPKTDQARLRFIIRLRLKPGANVPSTRH